MIRLRPCCRWGPTWNTVEFLETVPLAVALGGGSQKCSHSRNRIHCFWKLVLSSSGRDFRRRGRNPRNNYEKLHFCMEIWIKILKIFLKPLRFFFIWYPNAEILHALFVCFLSDGEYSVKVDYLEFVDKMPVDFLQKFHEILSQFL